MPSIEERLNAMIHGHSPGRKDVTRGRLEAEHQKALKEQRSEPGVTFLRTWADPDAGVIFCLSEVPNRGAVQRVHKRAGHRANAMYEVTIEHS
jgi:hypothetical protein